MGMGTPAGRHFLDGTIQSKRTSRVDACRNDGDVPSTVRTTELHVQGGEVDAHAPARQREHCTVQPRGAGGQIVQRQLQALGRPGLDDEPRTRAEASGPGPHRPDLGPEDHPVPQEHAAAAHPQGQALPDAVDIARAHKAEMTQVIAELLPDSAMRPLLADAAALVFDGAIVRAQMAGDAAEREAAVVALRTVLNALVARRWMSPSVRWAR